MKLFQGDEVFRRERPTDANLGQDARLDRIEFAMVAEIFDDPRFLGACRMLELQQRRTTVFEQQRCKARIQQTRNLVERIGPVLRFGARGFDRHDDARIRIFRQGHVFTRCDLSPHLRKAALRDGACRAAKRHIALEPQKNLEKHQGINQS